MSTTPNPETPLTPPFEVVTVVDTRDFVEVGDRWRAVPGSGVTRECDRCGCPHEIHVSVVDAAGTAAIVGVGCMDADANAVRRLTGKATRAAQRAAREDDSGEARKELARITAEADGLTFPADEVVKAKDVSRDMDRYTWSVDGFKVWGYGASDDDERVRCLADVWRRSKRAELAGGSDALRDLERRATR